MDDEIDISRTRLRVYDTQTELYLTENGNWVSDWTWFEPILSVPRDEDGSIDWAHSTEITIPGIYVALAWTWDTSNNRSEYDVRIVEVVETDECLPGLPGDIPTDEPCLIF